MDKKSCVEIFGVDSAQAAALQYHGQLELRQATAQASCPYLVVDVSAQPRLASAVNLPDWAFKATVRKINDRTENMLVFQRVRSAEPVAPQGSAPRP